MYTLTEIETQGFNFIELTSADENSKATICLNQGGRLSDFKFENIQILAKFDISTYQDNYASAILFPFANRIKDGEYTFNDSNYKLNCNEVDKNNALHGLVYNKRFVCVNKNTTLESASITIQYKDEGNSKGFPYKFNIELTYTLSKSGLNVSVKVINKDKTAFPYTLGWHPYFNSLNLNNSSISFNAETKYTFDKQQIITGIDNLNIKMPFHLKNVNLDDGYPLKTNEIEFLTPEYSFKIKTTSKENFLQLYTPKRPNTIAIEPMTGAADNFNNKIGLQTLQPNCIYCVEWNLAIINLTLNQN